MYVIGILSQGNNLTFVFHIVAFEDISESFVFRSEIRVVKFQSNHDNHL